MEPACVHRVLQSLDQHCKAGRTARHPRFRRYRSHRPTITNSWMDGLRYGRLSYVVTPPSLTTQLISRSASGGQSSVTPTAVQAGKGASRNSPATLSRVLS